MIQIIIAVALFFVLIIALVLIFLLQSKPHDGRSYILKKMEEIDLLSHSSQENDIRTALIHLDALLDTILKQKQTRGESLGERLKNARHHFDYHSYNDIWEAHKLRNRMVHEIDFRPTKELIKHHYISLRLGIKQLIKA